MRWLLKRWWFWAGAGFMLVAVVAGYLLIPVERDRITEANYDKIQNGWSAEQVEELLGYRGFRRSLAKNKDPKLSSLCSSWSNDDGLIITALFDSDLVVCDKRLQFLPDLPDTRTRFERIKERIALRIQALWP